MSGVHAATRRRGALPTVLALGVPFALGVLVCLLGRPEPSSLVAPLLGPWGGLAYGHSDCTMASAMPGWSAAAVGLGVTAFAALPFARSGARRFLALALLALWSSAWVLLALLSLLNTLS